jgi:hypothetical protein
MQALPKSPDLIPNWPKNQEKDYQKVMDQNGGPTKYVGTYKKDGVRLQLGFAPTTLSRSFKEPQSVLVRERFKEFNDICILENIALDGEFYMHGLKFNEIYRYYANTDVTREEYRLQLEKEFKKNDKKFYKDYNNRTIGFLTHFHEDLKFWLFDGRVIDRPDLVRFEDRMREIINRLSIYFLEDVLVLPTMYRFNNLEHIMDEYESALNNGYEGLVLTHVDHEYKFGRTRLNIGTIIKMKDDAKEYDGQVVDIIEGDKVKEGAERQIDHRGKSHASGLKGDREPSGKAKAILTHFEGLGTFKVSLEGFNDEDKLELLKNKDNYIGRHFTYSGMAPVKDYPRHAFAGFNCWRDDK